ncbi:MAG: hypothetical protein ACTHKK_02700 [Candidatus Nitrosocosmicus sp.]
MSSGIDLTDTFKKEARGCNNENIGEVQELKDGYVLVQRGVVDKEKYYIPQYEVESYDGSVLRFRISEDEIKSRYTTVLDMPPLPSACFSRDPEEKTKNR